MNSPMHKKAWLAALFVVALILIACAYGLARASVSALPDPGPLETALAAKARNWFIARAARAVPQPSVQSSADSISKGDALFDMDCASCHGDGGRAPTSIGRAMYPRAADLGSPEVQKLSNREIFWVIKNGVRLSGMPGFARVDGDPEMWQLTYYVRSLGKNAKH